MGDPGNAALRVLTVEPLPPAVVHVDDSVVVADKPAGLLAVPGRLESDCLFARLAACFPGLCIVHRLDMATSGLIVFARGAFAQRALSIQFAARSVDKHYVAVVDGAPAAAAGEIDLPLIADWPNRPRQRVDRESGKPSLTRWQVIESSCGCTRLLLRPVTGRSHQLRVHLASTGHPILGDALYAPAAVAAAAPRLLLHACHLAFEHPARGTRLAFDSPAPF